MGYKWNKYCTVFQYMEFHLGFVSRRKYNGSKPLLHTFFLYGEGDGHDSEDEEAALLWIGKISGFCGSLEKPSIV